MVDMIPVLRVQLSLIFRLFAIFFLIGCQEYNIHPSVSEAASLSGVIQLTDGFDRAGEAFFSPDARWIVFRAVPSGHQSHPLYLAKLDYNHDDITGIERPIRITPIDSLSEGGSISPDSKTILFASVAAAIPASVPGTSAPSSERFPIDMRIYRKDLWEGAVSMTDTVTGINLATHPLFADRSYNAECRFSPDARHIVFTSTREGNPNLFVAHPDGTHLLQLTRTVGYDGQASLSPDNKHLLYCSDRDANHFQQIYLADLTFDHTNGEITGLAHEHALTYDDHMNINPSWSPDGTHIVYATSRHGRNNYELYVMDRTGRRKTRLTYSPGADLFPVFSPDGRFIMWTSKRAKDGTIQVFVGKFQYPFGA